MEQGKRYNQGKPRMSLNPPEALIESAKVWGKGEKKYGLYNWRKGLSYCQVIDSTKRHLDKFLMGEDIDEESEESHIAHVLCNAMMLMTYIVTNTGTDDRYKYD